MNGNTPSAWLAIRRGLCRRCPRCGEGPLFKSWFSMHTTCTGCELQFEQRAGDTWGFWVLGDRVFLFVIVVVIYLGIAPETWVGRGLILAIVGIPLVATMPWRQGVFVALDYVSRTRWR